MNKSNISNRWRASAKRNTLKKVSGKTSAVPSLVYFCQIFRVQGPNRRKLAVPGAADEEEYEQDEVIRNTFRMTINSVSGLTNLI